MLIRSKVLWWCHISTTNQKLFWGIFFPTTNKTVTELPGVLNFLVHPTCQIKVNLYHYFNCKKNCCSSSLEPQQHPHQAVAFFRYAMRSARSCGFFSPGNTILVPGMYCIEKTQ
jgi:hypothetical protein